MNSSAKTAAKAAVPHAHAAQPTESTAPSSGASRSERPARRAASSSRAATAPKNVPATKTVMNVDSLVAKLAASSAPISAGWWRRGRARKRKTTASSASVMQAM